MPFLQKHEKSIKRWIIQRARLQRRGGPGAASPCENALRAENLLDAHLNLLGHAAWIIAWRCYCIIVRYVLIHGKSQTFTQAIRTSHCVGGYVRGG